MRFTLKGKNLFPDEKFLPEVTPMSREAIKNKGGNDRVVFL